jgi:hypothetical protein
MMSSTTANTMLLAWDAMPNKLRGMGEGEAAEMGMYGETSE